MYKKIMESNTDKVDLDLEHEYIICHKEKLNKLWNSGFRGHIAFKPECTGDLLLHVDNLGSPLMLAFKMPIM